MTSARPSRRARNGASRSAPAVLHLDTAVYSESALDRTRQAFAHLAEIETRREGRRWTVRFSAIDPAVRDRLLDEFSNYALSCLMVEP
ncbi:MAG: HxsD-like protein [Deltaproteobacteria bacterium]|nr:HxsD-like protein [Deltaproteobacteria bacterium]